MDEINKIDEQIGKLKKKRKNLIADKGLIYCPGCDKYYPKSKCKFKLSDDGVISDTWYECPKGCEIED